MFRFLNLKVNDQAVQTRASGHNWKISSSRSLRRLESVVTVRGTAPCAADRCPLEGVVTLCDLVSGFHSEVLLEQAASKAATLQGKRKPQTVYFYDH